MAFDGAPSDGEATAGQMLAELEAIFQTAEFERAPVMRRLLTFLVRTTLAGHGDELKAYGVAVDGLGRDPDFDAQSDSYPRVQVGRLRKMLDAHYASHPPGDRGRLYIKPGGYRVDLNASAAGAVRPLPDVAELPPATPAREPRIRFWIGAIGAIFAIFALVLLAQRLAEVEVPPRGVTQAPVLELAPMTSNGGDAPVLALAVRTVLGDALARTWMIRLRDPATASGGALLALDRPVYRLTGWVDTTGALGGRRIGLRLIDVATGDQIWSETIPLRDDGASLVETMRPAISSLIRPFGAIGTHQRRLSRRGHVGGGYACLLDYDSYFRHREAEQREPVRACIRQTIADEPMSAPALAAASVLEFDPDIGGGTSAAHARGADFARRAVAADPYSAEAHVADARAAFIAGQCLRGREISDRAVALNPYNPELIGLLGFVLFQCDDPQAEPLLRTAVTLDPDVPAFYRIALILLLLDRDDVAGATLVADTTRPPGKGMEARYDLTCAIAAAARGDTTAARDHWRSVVARSNKSGDDPDAVLAQYLWSPQFRVKVIRYLAAKKVI